MSDNVRITQNANSTPPDGTVIATDDVSGVQYQIMKLATGGDGEANLISSDNPITINIPASSALTRADIEITTLLKDILEQLKMQTLHLQEITDLVVEKDDLI
jgi:hypothetical protein